MLLMPRIWNGWLPLTLQLLEAGLPLILVLNIADEARSLGMAIDTDRLEKD